MATDNVQSLVDQAGRATTDDLIAAVTWLEAYEFDSTDLDGTDSMPMALARAAKYLLEEYRRREREALIRKAVRETAERLGRSPSDPEVRKAVRQAVDKAITDARAKVEEG